MKINYKEPYWVKFNWDMDSHHDNQYVTEFNKTDANELVNFIYNKKFIVTCEFKIEKNYKRDEIGAIFGKPGKNLGLTYNNIHKVLGFEFWTKGKTDDVFCMVIFPQNMEKEVENGVIISVVRDFDKIILYKNFEKCNEITFENDLIDDYKNIALFLGCSNPGTSVSEHRHHGEMDINYFSILNNISDIKSAKKIYDTENYKLVENKDYNKILCLYDFKLTNNINIVYDESKYTHFLEKVPMEFLL